MFPLLLALLATPPIEEEQPERCIHCGKENPLGCDDEGPGPLVTLAGVISAVAALVWMVVTVFHWVTPGYGEPAGQTLVQVIAGEWRWLVQLLHRVW